MITYKYTDNTQSVVHVIDDDGVSRSSMLTSTLPAGATVLPADPEPLVVPNEVTRFQARAALYQAGWLDEIEALIVAPETDRILVLAWQDALAFNRQSPFVREMAQQLGLTEQQLDDLFITAAQIE